MNYRHYLNIRNLLLSIGVFALPSLISAAIESGIEGIPLTLVFGPFGWPFVFYSGGSLFPFLGGGSGFFSLFKLLIDILISFLVVLFATFFASKIKYTSTLGVIAAIFIILGGITVVKFAGEESGEEYSHKQNRIQDCDINKDGKCDEADFTLFQEVYQESKGAFGTYDKDYNAMADITQDGLVDDMDRQFFNAAYNIERE